MFRAHSSADVRPADALWLLHGCALGRLEDLSCSGGRRERGPEGHASSFHVVLPHSGSFVLHTCGEALPSDCNRAVFLAGASDYAISHPASGDESLVFTPAADLVDELTGAGLRRDGGPAPASRSLVVPPPPRLAAAGLRRAADAAAGALEIEERLLAFFRRLIADAGGDGARRAAGGRLDHPAVARAKAYLHAHLAEDPSLVQVAEAVSVSPAHLTHVFRAVEGLPLYRYALRLRLACALARLEGAESLTTLAMELGFSSHSHFTAAFRKAFGVSPSSLRAELRIDGAVPHPRRPIVVKPLCPARTGDLAAAA